MSFDLKLDSNGDIVDLGVDYEIVQGSSLIAQDVLRLIHMPRGSLPHDRSLGGDIALSLNSLGSGKEIQRELVRIARSCEGVRAKTVVCVGKDDRWHLSFETLEGEVKEVLL